MNYRFPSIMVLCLLVCLAFKPHAVESSLDLQFLKLTETSGSLYIKSTDFMKNLEVTFYTPYGKAIKQIQYEITRKQNIQIPIHEDWFPGHGIYFARIRHGSNSRLIRFLVTN